MITKQTVLILGAGASVPYGFPTGRSLLLQITDELAPEGDSGLRQILLPFSDEHTSEFQAELLASNQPSVDAFIENRPSFTDIGKAAIAKKLIDCENEYTLTRRANLLRADPILSRHHSALAKLVDVEFVRCAESHFPSLGVMPALVMSARSARQQGPENSGGSLWRDGGSGACRSGVS